MDKNNDKPDKSTAPPAIEDKKETIDDKSTDPKATTAIVAVTDTKPSAAEDDMTDNTKKQDDPAKSIPQLPQATWVFPPMKASPWRRWGSAAKAGQHSLPPPNIEKDKSGMDLTLAGTATKLCGHVANCGSAVHIGAPAPSTLRGPTKHSIQVAACLSKATVRQHTAKGHIARCTLRSD